MYCKSRNARFTLSVKLPSSKFVVIRLFNVFIALFCRSVSCIHSGCAVFYFTISVFADFSIPFGNGCSSFIEFRIYGYCMQKKLLTRKFIISLVSAVLEIFTVGHLLNLSTAICISTSSCNF